MFKLSGSCPASSSNSADLEAHNFAHLSCSGEASWTPGPGNSRYIPFSSNYASFLCTEKLPKNICNHWETGSSPGLRRKEVESLTSDARAATDKARHLYCLSRNWGGYLLWSLWSGNCKLRYLETGCGVSLQKGLSPWCFKWNLLLRLRLTVRRRKFVTHPGVPP